MSLKCQNFLGWKSKSPLIVSLFDLWAHITQIYYIPSVYPHQSCHWTFCLIEISRWDKNNCCSKLSKLTFFNQNDQVWVKIVVILLICLAFNWNDLCRWNDWCEWTPAHHHSSFNLSSILSDRYLLVKSKLLNVLYEHKSHWKDNVQCGKPRSFDASLIRFIDTKIHEW